MSTSPDHDRLTSLPRNGSAIPADSRSTARDVGVNLDLRAARRAEADRWRHQMRTQGTLVVRLLSSPGAGKTSLLEHTLPILSREAPVGVLVGDIETERDAARLERFAPSLQITTGGACHLELPLVTQRYADLMQQARAAHPAAATIPVPAYLFVEDIGNLICPASHDLGEHLRVVLLSTTEGDDKPGKYPKAFRHSDVVIISKCDLLPYVPFSIAAAETDAHRINSSLRFFHTSSLRDDGIAAWCDFLRNTRAAMLGDRTPTATP